MLGIYKIPIKGFQVDIEVTWFQPELKCSFENPEYKYLDENMEFDWVARTDNKLLNQILEEDLCDYIDIKLRKLLE